MPLKRMMEVISHKPSLTLRRSGAAAATLRAVRVNAAIAVVFKMFMGISGQGTWCALAAFLRIPGDCSPQR
jgi:hypothetical protein